MRSTLVVVLSIAILFGVATAANAGDPVDSSLKAEVEAYVLASAEPTDSQAKPAEGLLPVPDYAGDWKTREFLSGDWGGTRTKWANKGVTFDFHWLQVGQGVVSGGVDENWAYVTNLDYYAKFDLMRRPSSPPSMRCA